MGHRGHALILGRSRRSSGHGDLNASAARFTLLIDNDNTSSLGNGESEVDFTSNSTKLCGSLACTTRYTAGGSITEADAYFDIGYDWELTVPAEPAYNVSAAETILVRQTAENRGKTTQNRVIKWYVSTDSFIATTDTLIATSNITLAVDTPYTGIAASRCPPTW